MKYLFLCLMSLLLIITVSGCATAPPPKPAYVPTFDYKPLSNAAPGSAEVSFAIVNASYSENQQWAAVWPFSVMAKNMGLDFQEILAARGFSVHGPYATYDEMTFPDKKASDLVLQPVLEIRLDFPSTRYKENISLLGTNTYSLLGDIAVSGRVTFSLMESISKERMWFKSVDLGSPVLISWVGKTQYQTAPQGVVQVPLGDPGLQADLAKALGKPMEDFYSRAMQAAWSYLDPEEMRLVKKQAEEVRSKKVY